MGWDKGPFKMVDHLRGVHPIATHRFQERDLRAVVASKSSTLEEASERLGHAGTEITKRVYRRKPTMVKPLNKGN